MAESTDSHQAQKEKLIVEQPKLHSERESESSLTDIPLSSRSESLPNSVISVPFRLTLAAAAQQLEKVIPKELHQDWKEYSVKGVKVEAKFQANREKTELSYQDGFIVTRHIINYHARFRARMKNPLNKKQWFWLTKGTSWGTAKKPNRIVVTLWTRLRVADDWRLLATTEIAEIHHSIPNSQGKFCVGSVFRLCISSNSLFKSINQQIESTLKSELNKTIKNLDRNFHKLVKLRERIDKLWNQIQCPLSLKQKLQPVCNGPLASGPYLLLQPKALHLGDITGNEKEVSVTAALTCRPRITFNTKPELQVIPLPKKKSLPRSKGFQILVDSELSFDELSLILNQNLKGKRFPSQSHPYVVVEKAAIVGFQEWGKQKKSKSWRPKLVIRLNLGGALPAVVYITGHLEYQKRNQRVRLADVDYSVETQNTFLQMMDEINHAGFQKYLAKYTNWDLNQLLLQVKKQIQQQINRKDSHGVRLTGRISSLTPLHFRMSKSAILLGISIRGDLQASFSQSLK